MVLAGGLIIEQRSRLFVGQHVLQLVLFQESPESPRWGYRGGTRNQHQHETSRQQKRRDEFLRPPNWSAACHPANASLRLRLPLFTALFAGPAILHARTLETCADGLEPVKPCSSTPHQASLLETHQHAAFLRQMACQARSISEHQPLLQRQIKI